MASSSAAAMKCEIGHLKRQLEYAEESLRWRDERLEDYRRYYREDIAVERQYRREDYSNHREDLEWIENFYRREETATTTNNNDSVQEPEPVPPVTQASVCGSSKRKDVVAHIASRCLTSVRAVGEAKLPTGSDVLPLISRFVLSTRIPIDVAVGAGTRQVTTWLLANGAELTPMSLRVAVTTGDVALFQTLVETLADGPSVEQLDELPLDKSIEITTWLAKAYPDRAAQLIAKQCVHQQRLLRDPCAWYSQRLKRQWEWETRLEEERAARKKARLEFWHNEAPCKAGGRAKTQSST